MRKSPVESKTIDYVNILNSINGVLYRILILRHTKFLNMTNILFFEGKLLEKIVQRSYQLGLDD